MKPRNITRFALNAYPGREFIVLRGKSGWVYARDAKVKKFYVKFRAADWFKEVRPLSETKKP